MPFSFALHAVNCPAPIPVSAVTDPTSTNPPVATPLLAGNTRDVAIPGWNRNGWLIDQSGSSCGGVHGVVVGLDFSSTSGLTLNIAAGWAYTGGMVFRSATTHALTDGATNYVWMNQAAGITHTTSPTPPAGASCYLGAAICAGGSVTSLDGSGVCYVGGMPRRRTGDAGAPGDTLPASVWLHTRTAGGIYLWDGDAHVQLG